MGHYNRLPGATWVHTHATRYSADEEILPNFEYDVIDIDFYNRYYS